MEKQIQLKKKRYTTLFFDLDNTIWDFNRNAFFALKENYYHFLGEISEQEFNRFYSIYIKYNDLLWNAYRKKEIGKKELIRKRFQDTFDEFGISGINPVEFNDSYLEFMPNQKHLIDGAREVLDYVYRKYDLFIITNGFREVQFKKLENSSLLHYFRKIFISEDLKSPKPNPEIFNYAITSANAKKEQSLMIGDDWDVDVIGACKVGIDSVFLVKEDMPRDNIKKQKNCKAAIYIISHLKELINIL